ncbi:MAG: hypothetical protein M1470_02260 [Bacteroidetes bacterium]|nr:hypothetical protein [Bacteroidota bacterium]MCL5737893.1 hypothetical protein [Bacteroidota bacterium]
MNKKLHAIYIGLFIFVGVTSTLLLAIDGYQYYTTPLVNRFFNPQDSLLNPSGLIGHGLGIVGSLMMIVGVAIYMIRKRVRAFLHWGYLKNWLELHIFLCTLGPIFVLFHTAFKFGGIVAVSFWSMTAVVLSGVIGRFIYVQIPRTIQGQMIGIEELNGINQQLSKRLREEFSVNENLISKIEEASRFAKPQKENLRNSISFMLKDSIRIRRILKNIKKESKAASVPSKEIREIQNTAKSKMILARRVRLLSTMQRFFRHWHIVHLPFAILMFFIMFIHIAVAIVFGYRWIF